MRIQIVVLAVGAACAALAVLFLSQQRSARAAESGRQLAQKAAERAQAAEVERGPELVFPSAPAADGTPELAALANQGGRTALEESLAHSASVLADSLIDELLRAQQQGLIGDAELANFLARTYLEHGDPARALQLLQRYESNDFGLWWSVAETLGGQGDRAGQREALLAALARWPDQTALLDPLLELDAPLVLARLRELLAAQPPPGDPELRARLARALARSGDGAGARALLEAMVAENPGDIGALSLLAEFDPERAIALLERQLGDGLDPDGLRSTLVQLLIGTGNAAGAQGVLERYEREGQAIDADEWAMVADSWLQEGDTARGVSALQRALAWEHGDPDNLVHMLEDLAPDALRLELERRVAGDEARNDEYWGSLADSYWRLGRTADARAAWERAYELDRDDGEWPTRLAALEAGRDPYGDG